MFEAFVGAILAQDGLWSLLGAPPLEKNLLALLTKQRGEKRGGSWVPSSGLQKMADESLEGSPRGSAIPHEVHEAEGQSAPVPWMGFGSGIVGLPPTSPIVAEEVREEPPTPRATAMDDEALANLISALGETEVLRIANHLKRTAERSLSSKASRDEAPAEGRQQEGRRRGRRGRQRAFKKVPLGLREV